MSPESTPSNAYELSELERDTIFRERIVPVRFGERRRVDQPTVHFVGGQPGAGKSNLQQRLITDIEDEQGENTVVNIVGDDLRIFHPRYSELLEQGDEQAAYYTDLDSGAWVERAIERSLDLHTNVVIEGTLRRPELTAGTAERYRSVGFTAELHVMVVHEFISRLSIVGRYLKAVQREGHGRYTMRAAHDEPYHKLPESLATLTNSGSFEHIKLYNREGQVVSQTASGDEQAAERLRQALYNERQASLLPTEVLLEQIARLEAELRPLGKQVCLDDLAQLRADVEGQP